MIGSVIAIGLLALAAWALGWPERKDPTVVELEKLRDEGIARREQMTEQEQQESREEFGERMRELSEEQRQTFFQSSMPMFLKMFEAQTDRFLAMSSEEQRKEMDSRIDAMQAAQAQGQNGPPGGSGGFGGNGQQPSPQQMDEFRKRMLDWTSPEQRAKFDAAFEKYNKRLQERGISPPGGGFF